VLVPAVYGGNELSGGIGTADYRRKDGGKLEFSVSIPPAGLLFYHLKF
jgi:hypothetical protein